MKGLDIMILGLYNATPLNCLFLLSSLIQAAIDFGIHQLILSGVLALFSETIESEAGIFMSGKLFSVMLSEGCINSGVSGVIFPAKFPRSSEYGHS